jgi:hypothetical protein
MSGNNGALPKNVHRQRKTGMYYFEFGKKDTLLIGPQRITIQETINDKNAILGAYATNPRKFARDMQAFAEGKAECARRLREFQSTSRGIQSRLGGFLVTRKENGKQTGSAMRFTFESAVDARKDLLAGKTIPWKLAETQIIQGSLEAAKYISLFIGFCGPLGDDDDELQGRAGSQRLELPPHTTWVNLQDCGHDHLDGNGSFQRCPLRPTTTPDSVLARIQEALHTVASKNVDGLPLIVYQQSKVYLWLFRLNRASSAKIWVLFRAATIVYGPHFSRLYVKHIANPIMSTVFQKMGIPSNTLEQITKMRSKRQLDNAFGSENQSESSKRLMGSCGFRQCPQNIYNNVVRKVNTKP